MLIGEILTIVSPMVRECPLCSKLYSFGEVIDQRAFKLQPYLANETSNEHDCFICEQDKRNHPRILCNRMSEREKSSWRPKDSYHEDQPRRKPFCRGIR